MICPLRFGQKNIFKPWFALYILTWRRFLEPWFALYDLAWRKVFQPWSALYDLARKVFLKRELPFTIWHDLGRIMISFGGGQCPAGGRFLSAADNARLADNARPGRDGGWTGGSDENIKKETTRAAGRVPRSLCLKHKKRETRELFFVPSMIYKGLVII